MIRGRIIRFLEQCWYSKPGPLYLLIPLEWAFRLAVFFRRNTLLKKKQKIPLPTIVVGNITVGGTGKTPVVIALAKYLKAQGYKPGIISRGYSKDRDIDQNTYSIVVNENSDPAVVGDEPLVIVTKTKCPFVVNLDRVKAGRDLIKHFPECDVLISDDGLQHYKMHRDLEICVLDGERMAGNGHQLPVGPLREGIHRLHDVNWIMVNEPHDINSANSLTDKAVVPITIKPAALINLQSQETKPLNFLRELERFVAVAGIGNPERYFRTLETYTSNFERAPFTDHHPYKLEDFVWYGHQTVVMTAKDAVKCRPFAKSNWWYLDVDAKLENGFLAQFHQQLDAIIQKLSHN